MSSYTRAKDWPLFCHGPRWFRVKGYGIRHVDHRVSPPFFSERNGYRRVVHVGSHCFALLKPRPSPFSAARSSMGGR